MNRKFRFAMCVDREGWCFERTADSLIKYAQTKSSWTKICAIDPQGQMLPSFDPTFDLYRFGGVPLFKWFVDHALITKTRHRRRCVPTFASFREATYTEFSIFLHDNLDLLAAVIINDQRMFPLVMQYGVPVIYSPDCVDPTIFRPYPKLRPEEDGPLRVGWAGSTKAWGDIKHVDEIEQACNETEGVEFVRQDRELDGAKDQKEMAEWFAGLHVYMSANDVETCTPVPQIEAIAGGVLPITTRCGERWDLVEAIHPELILADSSVSEIKRSLLFALESKATLSNWGMALRRRHFDNVISWANGEATRVTETFESLAMTVPLRKDEEK